jgi:hypothetical protein
MKKTRAVAMGTNAYPFLMRYWYEIFTQIWQDEVDRVYIIVSQPEHASTWGYTKSLLSSHPKIKLIETNGSWPASINFGTKQIQEDLVFICHDDTFIHKKGVLSKYFDIVEKENKVVTPITPIFAPQYTIEEILKYNFPKQLPIEVKETGEIGWSFYANMLFISRELLFKTSIDFGEYHRSIGQYCNLLNWTPLTQPWGADTNFLFELELLKAGAYFHGIPKYEIAHLYNLPEPVEAIKEMVEKKQGAFSDDAGWIHLQTLAYHIYGLYWDVGEKELIEKGRGGKIGRKMENMAASRGLPHFIWSHALRLAWILEFMSVGDYGGIQKYYDHAKTEIEWIIDYIEIDRKALKIFQDIFHKLIWKN